jgi:curved DNA-binding protein CbpA
MYRDEETSFYDLLEVGPNAGPNEIYEAYQRARETYSPQSPAIYSMFTEEEARELIKLIDEAYSTLSNRSRKRAYDLKLGLIKEEAPPPPPPPTATPYMPPPAVSRNEALIEERKVGRPEEGWSGVIKVHKNPEAIPKGKARTRFGTYDVDAAFERDIDSVEECDGSFLQKIREYRKVSLPDLSDAMKISKSVLVALEENDLARLPVQVFTRGIVVQYCRMLLVDENKLVDAYMKYFKSQKTSSP